MSTAADYFRFAQMLLNGGALDGVQCLSRKTVEYMLADHIPGFPGTTTNLGTLGYGFGLGFAVRRQDGFAVVPGSTGDAMVGRLRRHELHHRPEGAARRCVHGAGPHATAAYPSPVQNPAVWRTRAVSATDGGDFMAMGLIASEEYSRARPSLTRACRRRRTAFATLPLPAAPDA